LLVIEWVTTSFHHYQWRNTDTAVFTVSVKGDVCAEIWDKAEEIVEHEYITQQLRTRLGT